MSVPRTVQDAGKMMFKPLPAWQMRISASAGHLFSSLRMRFPCGEVFDYLNTIEGKDTLVGVTFFL